MNEQENPFKYRHEEQFEKDTIFLKLFSSGALDLIPSDSLMKRATIFFSTAGGGKSSLFRIFKPSSLLTTINYQNNEEYVELFSKLKERKIITNTKPNVLGVYLSCARNYDELELLKISPTQQKHLFFSLINARLLLIALRGIMLLKELKKTELSKIQINCSNEDKILSKGPFPCNGEQLYRWASKIENTICDLLDSYEQDNISKMSLLGSLDYLYALNPENITVNEEKIFDHTLVMLDDVQFLSETQRSALYAILQSHQIPLPIWLADRRENLDQNKLPGNEGREFTIVNIEDQFRSNGRAFENFVKNIASKRAKAGMLEITDFSQCVNNSMQSDEWNKRFREISIKIRSKIEEESKLTSKFNDWILNQENYQGTEKEKAIGWRTLEISVQRNLKGIQMQLFDTPLIVEEYKKSFSQITSAAEYFLNENYDIPYFCGFSRLSSLGSYNVEQFIEIAGNLFDEIISKSQLNDRMTLTPQEQESSIKKIARKYWEDIPRSIPNGILVCNFITEIGKMAHKQTIRPTAPYLPGVTGIGITTTNYFKLYDQQEQKIKPHYTQIADVIQPCIYYNILRPEYGYRQGQKGKTTYVVLQLNRLLCAHFGIPLGYGGWRPMKLEDLSALITPGKTTNEREK